MAHFAQQRVAAHVKHEVLRVRREAEPDFTDCLDEERGVGRMPCEMYVKMCHTVANELFSEKKRVARALLSLEGRAVSRFVLRDESGRPNAIASRKLPDRSHNFGRRGVPDFRAQIRPMSMA